MFFRKNAPVQYELNFGIWCSSISIRIRFPNNYGCWFRLLRIFRLEIYKREDTTSYW
jgi:hypothetical protein